MSIVLQSTGGGSVTISEPTTASNFTQTLPAGTGTIAVQGASTNIVSGTAVASTSGTSIDFTGIPSWAKRITVMFNGVSTNGASNPLVQIGAGSVTTSGYLGSASIFTNGATVASVAYTTGFGVYSGSASNVFGGQLTLTLLNSNIWVCSGNLAFTSFAGNISTGGYITLGGTLDRVRITTVNGTDAFDAGSINILYE